MPAHSAGERSLLGAFSKVTRPIGSVVTSAVAAIKRSRRNQLAVGGSTLLVAGTLVGLAAGGVFSSSTPPRHHHVKHQAAVIISTLCPLTDLPAPGGIPQRPALAVKIGNEPPPGGARPQSGLNEADIVYDTPAEGFIMRYVAVFQCNNAPSIGPTRSVRWVDWHIIQQFGHPILAFAGGIDPDVNTVLGLSWLEGADLLEGAQNAAHRISSRSPPDNLYTSTAALYGLYPKEKTPPPSVFKFTSHLPAAAKPVAELGIDYSGGTDPRWTWDAKSHDFVHSYAGEGPDIDASNNTQVSTTNIIVESVHYSFGPNVESPGGSGDVESQTVGSGPGYVLRGGKIIDVTWHCPALGDPTTFSDAAGQPVGLAPGRTWVELVPDTTFSARPAR